MKPKFPVVTSIKHNLRWIIGRLSSKDLKSFQEMFEWFAGNSLQKSSNSKTNKITTYKKIVLLGFSGSGKKIFMYRLINNKDINDILEKEIRVKNEEDIYVLNIIVLECENWNDDKISLCESSDCILYFCKGYNEEIEKIKNIRSTIKFEHISHKIMAMDPPELPEDPEMRAFALIYGNMYPCTGLIPLGEEKGVYKGEHIEGFSESGCWHSSTGPSFPQSYYFNYISDLILEKTKSTSS